MKNRKIFLIGFLLLFMTACVEDCKSPTTPELPGNPVDLTITYIRVDDNPMCPLCNPQNDLFVYLAGDLQRIFLQGINQAEKVGTDTFQIMVPRVGVNYPKIPGSDPYVVSFTDNVFGAGLPNNGCIDRAHRVIINGYEMKNIWKNGSYGGWDFGENGEFLLVRIDKDGVPHEVIE